MCVATIFLEVLIRVLNSKVVGSYQDRGGKRIIAFSFIFFPGNILVVMTRDRSFRILIGGQIMRTNEGGKEILFCRSNTSTFSFFDKSTKRILSYRGTWTVETRSVEIKTNRITHTVFPPSLDDGVCFEINN